MARADTLIEANVAAGFSKIHLDCSAPCAGDPMALTDDIVAGRAARLAAVAERLGSEPLYVVGTEVPVPGGAREALDTLTPTDPDAARATIATHRQAFERAGVAGAWPRVIGLVVQPGVEFDHLQVVDYDPDATGALSRVVDEHPNLVFEAHSTDYQTPEALAALVNDHFAILKVGPGLTFALREALFALQAIEEELIDPPERSDLGEVVERRMRERPEFWQRYYAGDERGQHLQRRFSYSDRMRYYWPDSEIQAAQARLLSNLARIDVPPPLLSQHLPDQYRRVRGGLLGVDPRELLIDRIADVLRVYAGACSPSPERALA